MQRPVDRELGAKCEHWARHLPVDLGLTTRTTIWATRAELDHFGIAKLVDDLLLINAVSKLITVSVMSRRRWHHEARLEQALNTTSTHGNGLRGSYAVWIHDM